MTLTIKLDSNDGCDVEHTPVELGISIFIACGLLISYLPQHYRIIKIQSSEGISPWFLLLGTVSGTSSLFNMVILQYRMLECCARVTAVACFENTLGIIQLAIQWAMFMLILVLYLLYFPEYRKLTHYVRHLHHGNPPHTRSIEWRVSLGVAYTVSIHFLLVSAISWYLLKFVGGPTNWETEYWADFLGIMSMLLASIQYLPQIWKTWKRKSVGALSIPMMLMQTPGSFLFVYSLAIRPGTNWTSWIVFLVTGCLQGTLLVMCIVFHFRARRLGHGPFYVGDTESLIGRDGQPFANPTERTGLLADDRPKAGRNDSYGRPDDEAVVE